ncbi:MAG: hypothetical protein H6908_05350 [Hyphomicrobiales bacterium]|nr:hypothetical protein [Hyphomicrobiales bacterium]
MSKHHQDIIRNFGMANMLTEVGLDKIEREYNIDLRKGAGQEDRDEKYYPQFEAAIRNEAAQMAQHYEIFYCLEKSIRGIIRDRLQEFGENWWEEKIPEQVKTEAKKRHEEELGRGVTPRSYDLLDYTNFGELNTIINKNWDESFSDMFSNRDAVRNVMTMLNTLRGPIAHCSPLAEDEVTRLHMSLRDWFRLME